MTNVTRKIAAGIASGALLVSLSTQIAFADTNILISGNGRGSDNTSTVNNNSNTSTVQSNSFVGSTVVTNNTNTGGNSASDNVGNGGVSVHTGDTTSNTTVNTAVNSNKAVVADCGCNGNSNVEVSGNGRDTTNTATLNKNNNVAGFQSNAAYNTVVVANNSNTGNNSASDNLGGNGGVDIHTGNSTQNTTVNTVANSNAMVVGGGMGTTGGNANLLIAGNLRDSDNAVTVNMNRNVLGTQDNFYLGSTIVANNANSGDNSADDNLGTVRVHTGDLMANTNLNTAANFNAANFDACGCAMNVNAKAAGNGRDSVNDVTGNFNKNAAAFQGNNGIVDDFQNSNLNSGNNSASDNGGLLNGDPSIETGNGKSNTNVNRTGNTNIVGPSMSLGGAQVNMTWNWAGMLSWLGFFS